MTQADQPTPPEWIAELVAPHAPWLFAKRDSSLGSSGPGWDLCYVCQDPPLNDLEGDVISLAWIADNPPAWVVAELRLASLQKAVARAVAEVTATLLGPEFFVLDTGAQRCVVVHKTNLPAGWRLVEARGLARQHAIVPRGWQPPDGAALVFAHGQATMARSTTAGGDVWVRPEFLVPSELAAVVRKSADFIKLRDAARTRARAASWHTGALE